MRARRRTIVAFALLAALSACGVEAAPAKPDPSTPTSTPDPPYTGPLYLAPDELRSDADRLTGAAGRVVSCRTRITGSRDDPDHLHEGAPARSPQRALKVGYGEGLFHTTIDVFELEREEAGRALFVHRVDGVVKQSVIVHHGPTMDRGGKVGWYVETRARCDWAELPDDLPTFLGLWRLEIWTGPDGQRAPTYDIVSGPGPEHCDWQSMTFLTLNSADAPYVREPQPELEEYFAEPYRSDVEIPADAIDTGYSREGRKLWLAKDRRRAYVGSAEHAELWPITAKPMYCA